MRIRPGRTRSLIAGVMALLVMIIGVVMMSQFGAIGAFKPFMIIWIIIGLVGAGVAFYNAFSREGVPLYEIERDQDDREGGAYCPQCGQPVSPDDRFCRNCGARLGEEEALATGTVSLDPARKTRELARPRGYWAFAVPWFAFFYRLSGWLGARSYQRNPRRPGQARERSRAAGG